MGVNQPKGTIYTTMSEEKAAAAQNADQRELTYGEKAVGITFNPGGNPRVEKIKRLYADVIDEIVRVRDTESSHMNSQVHERAVMSAIEAQMMAVKAITFQY